ncbi:cilia- and flagella-associated protein 97-like [Glandiceps talaboti]
MADDLGEPVDHDFFDMDEPKSDRHRHDSSPERRSSRDKRSEGKQNGGGDWTTLLSARSTSSSGSRREIQAKIPTGTPREGDYIYSSDEDQNDAKESSSNSKYKNRDEDSAKVSVKDDRDSMFKARRNLKSAGPRRVTHSKDTSPSRDKRSKDASPNRDKEKKKGDKHRKRRDSYSSESGSESDSYSSYSSSEYSSYSDSESEITDVSPLPSPQGSPRRQRREKKIASDSDLSPSSGESPKHIEGKPPKRPMSGKRSPRYTDLVTDNYSGVTPNGQRDRLLQGTDARDLSLLLKAVLELDESARHTLRHGVSESSTNKVLFRRPTSSKKPDRKNLSFSNDRVSEIDVENQRLLREIMKGTKPKERKKPKAESTRPVMLSHAALNRAREQRRIERENWNMLKRIEAQKATTYLQRDSLLKEHDKQFSYGLQVTKPAGERPQSAKKPKSAVKVYAQSMGSRTCSLSSLRSGGSRPGSGRPTSAKKPPENARPAWDDRW